MMQAMPQIASRDTPQAGSRRTIPYDYAFRYELEGEGRVLNSTVTVSVEATFVAVSIGYGVIPKVTPINFGPLLSRESSSVLGAIRLRQIINGLEQRLADTSTTLEGETGAEAVLKNGFRLNPAFAELVLAGINGLERGIEAGILENLFQVIGAPPEEIQFLYALFDEGSGRAFQSDPILNIAGLGISNGDRPFRYFAQPITFAPRSTIRMEVTEVSAFKGELHVALHGYKVLGGAGTPTDIRRGTTRARRR
jgi:hypothetical protein